MIFKLFSLFLKVLPLAIFSAIGAIEIIVSIKNTIAICLRKEKNKYIPTPYILKCGKEGNIETC
jgi:hypothetical protein